MNFCDILKDLRAEKDVTQKEVAEACAITPTCICQLESGVRNPTGSTIKALAKYFGVSADYLLGLEDDFGNIMVTPNTPTIPALTQKEKTLLNYFRSLSPYLQDIAMDAMQTWATKPMPSADTKKKQA